MLAEGFEAFRGYFGPYMEKHGVKLPGDAAGTGDKPQ
jgi:NADH dehydrogenase